MIISHLQSKTFPKVPNGVTQRGIMHAASELSGLKATISHDSNLNIEPQSPGLQLLE